MEIRGTKIGTGQKPYVIAEMSNNHLKDISRAYKLIDAAKDAGADAVKIQTYTADSLTIDCDKEDFIIQDDLWKGQTYYQLYSDISMPPDWTEKLFQYADKAGITLFSSPFDEASVQLLESLHCPAYKIASFELSDPVLLKAVARTGKPVIMSTGVSTEEEIVAAVEKLKQWQSGPIALLHCTSAYPSDYRDMNLKALTKLADYAPTVGLSDHSLSNLAAVGAIALGASIVEKHFTLERSDGGPDAAFSLEPAEFKMLTAELNDIWHSLGNVDILNRRDRVGRNHARSLYAVADIAQGEVFTEQNVRLIRPGFGLPAKDYDVVIGQKASQSIERGTALNWTLIDSENKKES